MLKENKDDFNFFLVLQIKIINKELLIIKDLAFIFKGSRLKVKINRVLVFLNFLFNSDLYSKII